MSHHLVGDISFMFTRIHTMTNLKGNAIADKVGKADNGSPYYYYYFIDGQIMVVINKIQK